AGRAFTTRELCDYMLGVRLSPSQTIQYAKKWGNSRKKTSPVHVNKADMQEVED
ncbi:MAG: winged helix-turn-helix domain-containing protein, partial [Cenarchaeum sp. SB0661_bin_35]|nr:winged helix-turn-helix domain-containing protein [Cenarchaeum sp. SB0661_bin_35]